MMRLTITILGIAFALSGAAQSDYVEDWNPDADGDGNVGVTDLLALLSVFSENDVDGDGIWDSVDDCIGVYDPCGVCNGTGEDNDEDGLCDDMDDCIGAYDECGVCNGPGPDIPVIDEILYETDSVFIEALGEWYVFEYATDTLFTYVCPVSGCTDETASNYNPEAVIEDGSCAYGPLECGGVSTVTFDGYTYDLLAIGDQCWFAENLRTEHYTNGDTIPTGLNDADWENTSIGAVAVYGEGNSDCYEDSPDGDACDEAWSLNEYGRLYNWYAVDDPRGLCPSGWHIPSDGEWNALTDFLDCEYECGWLMKSTSGWWDNYHGSNSSGFTALPSGLRRVYGPFPPNYSPFIGAGSSSYWWSSTSTGSLAWNRWLGNADDQLMRDSMPPSEGYSIRCLRDSE